MEGTATAADGTVKMGALPMNKPDRVFNNLEPEFTVSSPVTRQKAAAAKQFIENHYKNYLQGLQHRKERRWTLQRRAQEVQIPSEEQEKMLRNLEKRETEFMKLQRHKVGIDDFEQLTVIGKGAFGSPWFKGVNWDMLYEMEAAYRPIVTGELDTQNFEKFPEVEDPSSTAPRVGPWRKV